MHVYVYMSVRIYVNDVSTCTDVHVSVCVVCVYVCIYTCDSVSQPDIVVTNPVSWMYVK